MAIAILAIGVAADQTYQLVWSDEFNGNSLDTSKWQYEVNCDGGGNNEMQCYTSSKDNVAVRNGSLVITARVQNANGKQYTSGRINTKGTASWKYGRFDARAKLPEGIYMWPALWMMPKDSVYGVWAASGEIDIMENRGGNNFEQQSTLHFGGTWPKNVYEGSGVRTMPFDMTKDFHVYSAVWTPDQIQFLVDNKVFHTMSLQRSFNNNGAAPYTKNGQPFDQEFFYIINLAVGGGFFGGNSQALTTAQARAWANPQFEVDYVRAYQLKDGGVVVNPSPAPSSGATPASSTSSGSSSNTNNGGCAAGACGAASCCMDQKNGQQCYNAQQYSCPIDSFTGKNVLCPAGYSVCNGACFNVNSYHCVNGGLQAGAGADVPATKASSTTKASTSSTTSSTTSSSTTKPVTSSTTKATSSTQQAATSSACPSGQTQCNDANYGNVCFPAGVFSCVVGDDNKQHLCPLNTAACGATCYPPTQYVCTNGWLSRK